MTASTIHYFQLLENDSKEKEILFMNHQVSKNQLILREVVKKDSIIAS